jgi:hypothetical protein
MKCLTEAARADHTETVRGNPRDVWQRAVTNGDRRCYFFFAGGALRTVTVAAGHTVRHISQVNRELQIAVMNGVAVATDLVSHGLHG